MAHRDFNTEFWDDAYVQLLSPLQKLLYIYLANNSLCTPSGVYSITVRRMEFDLGIPGVQIQELLASLSEKIKWLPAENIIWIKGFFRWQNRSPKFQHIAIASLRSFPIELVNAWYNYNGIGKDRILSPESHVLQQVAVLVRDQCICQYCHKAIENHEEFELDHVIPLSKGGRDNYRNIVTSCRACNQKKGDKLPHEAGFQEVTPAPYHASQAFAELRQNPELCHRVQAILPDITQYLDTSGDVIKLKLNSAQNVMHNVDLRTEPESDTDTDTESVSEGKGSAEGKGKHPKSKAPAKVYLPVDDAFTATMVERFGAVLGGENGVRERIEEARGYIAWNKWPDKRSYVRNWLRRSAEERSARNNGTNTGPPATDAEIRALFEKETPRERKLGQGTNETARPAIG